MTIFEGIGRWTRKINIVSFLGNGVPNTILSFSSKTRHTTWLKPEKLIFGGHFPLSVVAIWFTYEWTHTNHVNFMKIVSNYDLYHTFLYINVYINIGWLSKNASPLQTSSLHEYKPACGEPMVQACGKYVYKEIRMVTAVSATRMLMKTYVAALKKHDEIFNGRASVHTHWVHNCVFVHSHLWGF